MSTYTAHIQTMDVRTSPCGHRHRTILAAHRCALEIERRLTGGAPNSWVPFDIRDGDDRVVNACVDDGAGIVWDAQNGDLLERAS